MYIKDMEKLIYIMTILVMVLEEKMSFEIDIKFKKIYILMMAS